MSCVQSDLGLNQLLESAELFRAGRSSRDPRIGKLPELVLPDGTTSPAHQLESGHAGNCMEIRAEGCQPAAGSCSEAQVEPNLPEQPPFEAQTEANHELILSQECPGHTCVRQASLDPCVMARREVDMSAK
eukprot:scaffold269022_cov14-Prasinocladus_malaysianus.AAC.1